MSNRYVTESILSELIRRCDIANLPDESLPPMIAAAKTGVYYGYAQITPPEETSSTLPEQETCVLPMVMSFGWNPFYKNERMTVVSLI
jgi:riboflavin kinase